MQKKCPECGFELQEDDVFCMNCGASLEEETNEVKEETPKKKFNWLPLAIIGGILIILAVSALIIFNSPQVTLLRAGAKAVEEYKADEAVKRIEKIVNGGSVEASTTVEDIAGGFKIPLISDIDATASAKYYLNEDEGRNMLKLTGSLGGATALGAELWFSPSDVVVRSTTLLGSSAFGIDLKEKDSVEEAKDLIKKYLNVDADGYDKYLEILQVCIDEKDTIEGKLAKQLGIEVFKNAEFRKDSDVIEIKGEDVKTKVVTVSMDKECLGTILNNIYDFAKEDEDFKDVIEVVDKYELLDSYKELSSDYRIRMKYYIDEDGDIVRSDIRLGDSKSQFVRNKEDGSFELTYEGDVDLLVIYDVKENTEDKFDAQLTANDINATFTWDKDSEDWKLESGIFTASGNMDIKEDRIDGRIEELDVIGLGINPKIDFVIKNEDKMPEVPTYTVIYSQEDVDSLIKSVYEKVMDAIKMFLPVPEPEPEPDIEEAENSVEEEGRKSYPISATYTYDDGNEFSMDFKTGNISTHVQCKAVLNIDGTYTLDYTDGMISYTDHGTYKKYDDNTMEFASSTGINATGKYKDSTIEVTIPTYGSVELKKEG